MPLALKRAFLKLFDQRVRIFIEMALDKATTRLATPTSASSSDGRTTSEALKVSYEAYLAATDLARDNASSVHLLQLVFDEAVDLVTLVGCVLKNSESSKALDCGRDGNSAYDAFRLVQEKLERQFPIIDNQTRYTLRFAKSGQFLDNGSYVDSSEDFCGANSRFQFVLAGDSQINGNRQDISLGATAKFGLQSYCWRQKENRFVCEQIHNWNFLQSRTWLLADEEWITVSLFRSVKYARPLRMGDLFLLRTVGGRTAHQKLMANPEHDHLKLRNNPNEACYLMAMSDVSGRFVYEA